MSAHDVFLVQSPSVNIDETGALSYDSDIRRPTDCVHSWNHDRWTGWSCFRLGSDGRAFRARIRLVLPSSPLQRGVGSANDGFPAGRRVRPLLRNHFA
jgi:hypothetical protein